MTAFTGVAGIRVHPGIGVGRVGKPHGVDGSFFVEDASDAEGRFAAHHSATSSIFRKRSLYNSSNFK